MAKKKKVKSDKSLPHTGQQILTALTQEETAHLLNALFEVLPPDSQDKALARVQEDTRQTIQQILTPSATTSAQKKTGTKAVSTARQAQTWSGLWNEWYAVVTEAGEEDGEYIAQEAHWEAPYFDETSFVQDLEIIAEKMRPLLQTAFQNGFSPDAGFSKALIEVEEEVTEGLPEWMELVNGLGLEENLTTCLMEWEWLATIEKQQDPFAFALRIREWEDQASYVSLDTGVFREFFTELPEEEQQTVFQGLNRHKDQKLWKEHLEKTYSHWHALYMYWVDRYDPEQYLVKLRSTISQQWENGLSVIEDLLAQKSYKESLAVIKECLQAMMKYDQENKTWKPETSLLVTHVSGLDYRGDYLKNHKTLIRYYQKTAKGLGDSQLENALKIQHIAFNHFFNWQHMFKAFDESALPVPIRQALFQSWRDAIIRRTRPGSWGFGWTETKQTWWLHWLFESIAEPQKGSAYFQKEITGWLKGLQPPWKKGRDSDYLRLLTKDLTEMSGKRRKKSYPQFYQVVIRPGELSNSDDASRQEYLQQFAPENLLETVMAFWEEHLQEFVPSPKDVHKSDYSRHAEWMAALKELAPRTYESLLDQWRVEHERRRNLWKAMEVRGLK